MFNYKEVQFTYGSEIEAADWDTRIPLPAGTSLDYDDYTVANSNGLANDPKKTMNPFGGEVNVRVTQTPEEAVEAMMDAYETMEGYTLNYSCNLHLHIGVPGLLEDIDALKRLNDYIFQYQDELYSDVLPKIPEPPKSDKAARKRYNRRKQSHRRLLSQKIYDMKVAATTVEEFKDATSAKTHGMWVVARPGINMNSLWDNGTIEFRHFPPSDDPVKLQWMFEWCANFVWVALNRPEISPSLLLEEMGGEFLMDEFRPFIHTVDEVFQATHFEHHSRKKIAKFYEENGYQNFSTMSR